jgi:hypothetical protein
MRYLRLALLSCTLLAQTAGATVASAASPPPNVRALLKTEHRLDDKCRGGSGDSPATQKACEQRDAIVVKLQKLGWCFGNGDPNQIEADKFWQKCRKGSHS